MLYFLKTIIVSSTIMGLILPISSLHAATYHLAIQDTMSPTVAFTNPLNGAVISGADVNVSASSTDNIGVTNIVFRADGQILPPSMLVPDTAVWDSTKVSNGSHILTATAFDAGNNSATATISVSVNNTGGGDTILEQQGDITPPSIVFSAPKNGATVSGSQVSLFVDATDNIGVTNIVFKADGQVIPASILIPNGTNWDSTNVSNGTHALTATAYDAANNSATSTVTVTVNNAPKDTILEQLEEVPVVLPIVVFTFPKGAGTGEVLSGSIVQITAQVSNAVIVAGMTFSIDNVPIGPEDTSEPYSILLDSNKVSNGTHVLKAVARDVSNNTGFTTLTIKVNNQNNEPGDAEPPTVFITSPSQTTVSGTVIVAANASDNVGVAGVTFNIDGIPLGGEDTSAPYAAPWNSKSIPNGQHTITAVARDEANNAKTATMIIGVNNQEQAPIDTQSPVINLTKPTKGQTVSGKSVIVSAAASDNVGVAGVTFKVDGLALEAEDTVAPYSVSWDSTNIANGSHTVTALVRDAANNTSQDSAEVTVTNQNTPTKTDLEDPSVKLTSPGEGVTISGSNVGFSADASDNIGVISVSFEIDGVPIGDADTSAPYAVTWNSTVVGNGSHVISAVAHDAVNNVAISSHTVTINNQYTNNNANSQNQAPAINLGTLQALQTSGGAIHKLIKLPNDGNPNTSEDSVVYYIGADAKRHSFANSKIYFTWYCNFDTVETISGGALATLPLGSNVPYHPGVRMVKFTTDPKVYVVGSNNLLRPIDSEAVATALYGPTWNKAIDDIPDSFYSNYTFGSPVSSASDYNVANNVQGALYPSDSMSIPGYVVTPWLHAFFCANQANGDDSQDSDGDGLSNGLEKQLGTDPTKMDTDSDNLKDAEEVQVYKTNPLLKDTDGDSFSDYQEIVQGFNPLGPGKCPKAKCLP